MRKSVVPLCLAGIAVGCLTTVGGMPGSVAAPPPSSEIPNARAIIDTSTPQKDGYYVTASDEFNGNDVNRSLWTDRYLPHWTNGDLDKATYRVEDGSLSVYVDRDKKPWDPAMDGSTQVSGLSTYSRDYIHNWGKYRDIQRNFPAFRGFQQRYGYAEARIRAHQGDCTHVAFWALGNQSDLADGEAPRRNGDGTLGQAKYSAEIDITETLGREPGGRATHAFHSWGDSTFWGQGGSAPRPEESSFTDDYHVYAMDWDEDGVRILIDGKVIKSIDRSPQYPMFYILNAYAKPNGGWTCTDQARGGDPKYPVTMDVDYFRVYQKIPRGVQELWVGDSYLRGTARRQDSNPTDPATRGEGIARFVGGGNENDATFTHVYAPQAGTYRATLTYASGEDRNLDVQVNSGPVQHITNMNSNAWGFGQPGTVEVELKLEKGANRVRLFNPDAPAPDLGKLSIDMTPVSVPAAPVNQAPVLDADDVSLTVGDTFDNPVEAAGARAFDPDDKDADLEIRVARNEVDTAVAGSYPVTFSVTDAGGATVTKTITVTVSPAPTPKPSGSSGATDTPQPSSAPSRSEHLPDPVVVPTPTQPGLTSVPADADTVHKSWSTAPRARALPRTGV